MVDPGVTHDRSVETLERLWGDLGDLGRSGKTLGRPGETLERHGETLGRHGETLIFWNYVKKIWVKKY